MSFAINAAGQVYKQTIEVVDLGGAISAHRDLGIEITRRLQRAWACFQRYKIEIYDRPGVRLRLKVRLLKAEVIENLLYGCTTWSPNNPDYDRLRRVYYPMLLQCLGWGSGSMKTTPYRMPTRACQDSFREHRSNSAQTEDIACGIRSTHGGGASTTEGDVRGVYWG